MPRKRRANKAKEQMSDATWDYLCDKHDSHATDPFRWWETFALEIDFNNNIEQLWNLHRDVILAEHVKENPGTRPALWWRYDAPRLPVGTFPGWYIDGKLPQPRKRDGGIGTPAYEVSAIGPSFAYGIPEIWVGTDEDDPPIFESQAEYLKRHGFLLTGEERRAEFEPEAV
jgi:hypothetical protein